MILKQVTAMVRENPAPAEDAANSDTTAPGTAWAASARALTAKGVANGTIDAYRAGLNHAAADFAERHNALPVVKSAASLWGYGDIDVHYSTPNGEWWCVLHELVGPTGVAFEDLQREFRLDLEDDFDDVDVMTWPGPDDETYYLELVKTSFAMRIFMGISPWSNEFAKAMLPLFRRALVDSGLGNALGPVVRIREDGTVEQTAMSLNEFVSAGEPLATEDEARAQAFRGPVIQ